MGYQALLFCPDDKTSRSVTQVLSELDFNVVACTEPFAAVKKMMAERFDAVVVDCDNEQNATLLFKSARNTATNQSSLAVAVVEGQAGVAKAFRIGANLVLTKPINVEQAKGTLRVARGLLRKNETAKAAAPASAAKPASLGTASKPASEAGSAVRDAKLASPTAPAVAATSIASPAAKAPKNFPARDAKFATAQADDPQVELLDVDDDSASSTALKPSIASAPAASAPSPKLAVAATVVSRTASSTNGAASAPAPARDSKSAPVDDKASAANETPAPSFSFGGAVESGAQASKSGKKVLVSVAAVVLVAVGGFAMWMKFGSTAGQTTGPAAIQPAKVPAPVPAAPVSEPTAAPSPVSAETSVPGKTEQDLNKPSQSGEPVNSVHSSAKSKPSAATASTKPSVPTSSVPTSDEDKAVAKSDSQPIVIQSGTEHITHKPATSDAAAPSLDGVAVGSAVPMSGLMVGGSTVPAPVLQSLTVSQGVSQGLLIKRVNPIYPANALRMRVEGTVQLQATVSGKGDITGITVLSGDKSLAAAATDAVKQWKYRPYLLNGSPVEIKTEITVKFELPQ